MQKCFCRTIFFFMFLANFIFVVSHLKIHVARKLRRYCSQKEKFMKSLLAFIILML